MRFAFIFFLLAFFLSLPSAFAVDISVFERADYDRVVFNDIDNVDVKGDEKLLEIRLSSVNADKVVAVLKPSKTIKSVTKNDTGVIIELALGVRDTRYFVIGNRLILDIFFNPDIVVEPKPQIPVADVEIEPLEPVTVNQTLSAEDGDSESRLRVVNDEQQSPPVVSSEELSEPTIVTISSTAPFAMAAFQRYGRLFIVTDQDNMGIPPQITGHGTKFNWAVESIEMGSGSAWMMPIPEGAYIRPEGNGVVWRLIISDINPDLSTAKVRRRLADPINPKLDVLIQGGTRLLRLNDPDYEDDLAVMTVRSASQRMYDSFDFVDFDILPAVVGAVIKPQSDGVRVESTRQFLTVTRDGGLNIANAPQNEIVQAYIKNLEEEVIENEIPQTSLDRIFYFEDWGGNLKPHEFIEKRQELDVFLSEAQAESKPGILFNMVKLGLSQSLGQESLGYLDLSRDTNPNIVKTPEYIAVRGAAHFLASQHDQALKFFEDELLQSISEIHLWKAASLAKLDRDSEAAKAYIDNAALAEVYPYDIRIQVLAPIANALLNQEEPNKARDIVSLIDRDPAKRSREDKATVAYLKGRAQKSTGQPDEAISSLYEASTGDKLGPFGVRSELLLIEDELNREVIELGEAIKRMERLRFAWRGDSLEAEIYAKLGKLYIQNQEPRRGLTILKRAAENTSDIVERRAIIRDMADAFKSIFFDESFAELDALVAAAVYDEFRELLPVGEEGNEIINLLADKLMSIDLMFRAAGILQDKMERLEGGEEAIKSGLRIAAIQLLDRQAQDALDTLDKVDEMVARYDGEDKDDFHRKIVLLKARSLADQGEVEKALFMTEGLDDTEEVLGLRVDTAWRAGNWLAVVANLDKYIAQENITLATPPTAKQAQLILNQAIALSLAGEYDALQRFANEYDLVMKQSPAYKTFQVVTRPVNITTLADRDTLLSLTSEVDLFQDFLNAEKN